MITLYRCLLRLYPSSFRREYGDDMVAVFAEACADATPPGRLALFVRAALDDVPNAVAAHWAILIQDLRYTGRTLNRARGFAVTAILVIALGVGANTAAFSVADFVLLRPLPFPDPESLVRLCEGPRTGGGWGCMHAATRTRPTSEIMSASAGAASSSETKCPAGRSSSHSSSCTSPGRKARRPATAALSSASAEAIASPSRVRP